MKILMCNKFHFASGGTETYLFDLCQGLINLGHTVINFSTKDSRNIPSAYANYFVKAPDLSASLKNNPVNNIRSAVNFIYSAASARNIGRLINEHSPDIAHIHNIYHHISSSILYTLRKKGIPVVMTLHDYKLICPNYSLFRSGKICEECKGHKYYNAIRYRCLQGSYLKSALTCVEMYFCKLLRIYENNIDIFIAPSRFMQQRIIDFGIDSGKVYYLPHAINLDGFKPDFNPGGYILYYGSISTKKGVGLFIDTIKHLSGEVKVKIIGDGPLRGDLADFIKLNKLKNIELLGYRARKELVDFIRGCLFVVVPSLWPEVSGLNIYETFACGKCVIASNRGGIPELIEDGVNGLLFDPFKPGELKDKMQYLINNPQIIAEFGRNGFEKINKFNNRELYISKLLEIYSKQIKNQRN